MNNSTLWDKEDLLQAIRSQHDDFKHTITALNEAKFNFSWQEKWTAGQQMNHIRKSISPVVLAFRLPRFVLKYQFGVTNRPTRTYEALVARYLKALDGATAVAPKAFRPLEIPFATKESEIKAFEKGVDKLIKVTQKCSEKELDYYVLPHPLIGKLTLREMLFFTIYHVQHHHTIMKEIILNYPEN